MPPLKNNNSYNRYSRRPGPVLPPRPRMNHEITAPELRVIGETGENIGVITREQALALTRPQDGIDLILIAPTANPPVARIMSYDKFRYEEAKREKKERNAQKSTEMKHVQITVRAAMNDLMIKVRQAEKFFAEGHSIEVNLRLRGREKRNKELAMAKLKEFLKMIPTEHRELHPPRFGQNGPSVQIAKVIKN
jgi:translation initiation factor IF-3